MSAGQRYAHARPSTGRELSSRQTLSASTSIATTGSAARSWRSRARCCRPGTARAHGSRWAVENLRICPWCEQLAQKGPQRLPDVRPAHGPGGVRVRAGRLRSRRAFALTLSVSLRWQSPPAAASMRWTRCRTTCRTSPTQPVVANSVTPSTTASAGTTRRRARRRPYRPLRLRGNDDDYGGRWRPASRPRAPEPRPTPPRDRHSTGTGTGSALGARRRLAPRPARPSPLSTARSSAGGRVLRRRDASRRVGQAHALVEGRRTAWLRSSDWLRGLTSR